MTQLLELWQIITSELKKNFAPSTYDLYIENAEPIELVNNTLIIKVPADFQKKQWEEHIKKNVVNILNKYNSPVSISVYTESEFSPPAPIEAQVSSNHEEKSHLNPQYTFDTFVIGEGNKMSHAAALAVSANPGTVFNPLFIYGGVGLGKTHLMHAIGNEILNRNPHANVKYVTSETFTNDFINSIQTKSQTDFRNKYRNVDLLMVDDIQFLANKESTLEEFFHTFNVLHEANKQIVLSSDRLATEIPELPDRLVSRFESGLLTDITPPDLETRIAILRNKAISTHLTIPDDTLNYIAGQFSSNVRVLEGALARVHFYATINNLEINQHVAAEALKSIAVENNKRTISIYDIQLEVSKTFNVSIEQLKGKKRTKEIVIPRQIAMYLSRELTGNTLPKIGHEFGGKDHTTVMHSCDKIQNAIETNNDPDIVAQVEKLRKKLEK